MNYFLRLNLKHLMTMILLLACFVVSAQRVDIQGTVYSADGNEPIVGANLLIKGTTVGTVTDFDGKYSLATEVGDVVLVRFIGFNNREITITETTNTLDIVLESSMVDVDEVIVVGYGSQKKSDLTGAVSTVSSEQITRKPVATIEQAMQGLTAGVTVTANSGAPGDGAVIRIRGVGSINNTNPLYVIDGVPVDGPGSTNPADIESISVLKDAAASAIYGARGANGVVVITTKKGKKGFHVNFDAQAGVQKEWRRIDLLNAEEYAKYVNEVGHNVGGRRAKGPDATLDPFNQPYDTDWQDEMFRSAPIQRYNLGVSGGGEYLNYSASGGYLNQQGIMLSTSYKKYYARLNSEYKKGKLRIGESVAYNHSYKDNEKNGVGGRNQVEQMLKITPNLPVFSTDSTDIGGYAGPTSYHGHDAVNPVGIANLYENNSTNDGVLGSVYAEYEIVPGLKLKETFGFDYYKQYHYYHTPEHSMGSYHNVGEPYWSETNNESSYTLWENLLSYTHTWDAHSLDAMVGYSQERRWYETVQDTRKYYPSTDEFENNDGDLFRYESGLVSYFARVNYNYDSKYLFQANFRRDGSSKFGENKRWGIFPSFSGGWVVSKERFMASTENIISSLKVRASWGTLGNQSINDYQYEASLNPYQDYVFGEDEEIAPGTGPSSFPNSNVQWETTIQSNIGLDLGLFDNRVNLTAEYYANRTEDMLINITMPESNGSFIFPSQNAGSVENSGIELMLNFKNNSNKFTYSITGNITTINNNVVDLGPTDQPLFGGYSELGQSTKTEVGMPIGSFYGYLTDGIYKEESEIDSEFAPDAVVGDIRFKDLNGDGLLTDDDRDFIGNPIPDFTYGFNFSFGYGGFDMNMSFQGVKGNDIYRETKLWTEGMYSNFNASHDVDNRFRAEDRTITTTNESGDDVVVDYYANTDTDMPWAIKNDPNKNAYRFSDRYIEDGSYFRMKDLTVGYSFPSTLIEKMGMSTCRVYVTGMNIFTITDYTGYDPEIGGDNTSRGIDIGEFPQAKSFTGGIQISF